MDAAGAPDMDTRVLADEIIPVMTDKLMGAPESGLWARYSIFSVCFMAFCVSLGTAMVSLSKAMVLVAALGQLWMDGRPHAIKWFARAPRAVWFILASLAWFALSATWTDAYPGEAYTVFWGHARLLWLLAVLYVLNSPARAWGALKWLALGQVFVVLTSWMKWLGIPLNWLSDNNDPALGIMFTSTLEQPIMSTLLAVLLWHLRDHWAQKLGRHGRLVVYVGLLLTIANVLLIMSGRTGYLVMLVSLGLSFLMIATPRWRMVAAVTPIVVMAVALQVSPRVHERVMQIQKDLELYQRGDFNTSSGQRLDYWRAAVEGALERPWIGHGVGSYSRTYSDHGGFEKRILRDPHQQYLFWWAEGGLVAVTLLVGFLWSLIQSARALPLPQGRTLICTVAVAATMAFSTCPFFGAGMGEFLLLMMASLLATQARDGAQHTRSELIA